MPLQRRMASLRLPPQIPLDLSPQKQMRFESFLTSACNEKTVAHIGDWQNWPSPILLLIGEKGTGKTHLATAFAKQGEQLASLDDVETMDEAALFAQMNLALTGELDALLMTAASHPEGWNIKLPDLISRLKNTPVVELSEPDDTLLEGITRQLFEGFGRAVSKDVVTYIVSRTARTVASLQRLVENLEAQAQSDKADMSKAYVARHINKWSTPELF